MKKELIVKKALVEDKSKVMVFYYKDGKRTGMTGLFRELNEDSIVIMNNYQEVSFKIDEIIGVQLLEPRRSKEV